MTYRLTDCERERVASAFHEAGHAVAAVLLGGRVHLTTVDDTPRTEYDVLPDSARATVAYAGPWYEARWLAGKHPGPADLHRALSANPSDDKALCAAGGPAAAIGVVPLLERCLPAVKSVTKTLYFGGQSDHADVCAALGRV